MKWFNHIKGSTQSNGWCQTFYVGKTNFFNVVNFHFNWTYRSMPFLLLKQTGLYFHGKWLTFSIETIFNTIFFAPFIQAYFQRILIPTWLWNFISEQLITGCSIIECQFSFFLWKKNTLDFFHSQSNLSTFRINLCCIFLREMDTFPHIIAHCLIQTVGFQSCFICRQQSFPPTCTHLIKLLHATFNRFFHSSLHLK